MPPTTSEPAHIAEQQCTHESVFNLQLKNSKHNFFEGTISLGVNMNNSKCQTRSLIN